MDYVDHMHHMKCSAFSDSARRQTDVGGIFFHTSDVTIMPQAVFLASKSQTQVKVLGYEERQPFLCSTLQSPTTMAAVKCNDIIMATWPFYPPPEADNYTSKPKLH